LAGLFAAWSGCRRNKAAQQRRLTQINNGRADLPVSFQYQKDAAREDARPTTQSAVSTMAANCFRLGRPGAEMGIDLAGGFADSPRIAGQSLHLAIV